MGAISITNPFTLGVAQSSEDFCNRKQELDELAGHARNSYNVVVMSPRRMGKSSLVKRMLDNLSAEGYLTAYADFFLVVSEQDFVARLARALFSGIGQGVDPRSLLTKIKEFFGMFVIAVEAGVDEKLSIQVRFDTGAKTEILLDDLLTGLFAYLKKTGRRAVIVADEFQEITSIPNYKGIEGALRGKIQFQRDASFFFVGSRRRILQDMFSSRSRPFYKSALMYILKTIPRDEFVPCIVEQFRRSGKTCSPDAAGEIYDMVRGHTYYVQKLALFAWDLTEMECTPSLVKKAYAKLLSSEEIDFAGVWTGLSLSQKVLLRALAEEPTSSPYSRGFLHRHNMSLGGAQVALKALLQLDLVEQVDKVYRLTDPVLATWLAQR